MNKAETLYSCFTVSGREECVRSFLKKELPNAKEDNIGNVLLTNGGEGEPILLVSSMSGCGFFVTHLSEDGQAQVSSVGELDFDKIDGAEMISQRGVIGALCKNEEKKTWTIDVGAMDKKSAEKSVSVGEVFGFAPRTLIQDEEKTSAPSLDTLCGVAVLTEVAKRYRGTKNVVFAFLTRGLDMAIRPILTELQPQKAVFVFGEENDADCLLLPVKTEHSVCTPSLVSALERCGQPTKRICLQGKTGALDYTQQGTNYGTETAGILIPVTDYGTQNPIIKNQLMENATELLCRYLEEQQ